VRFLIDNAVSPFFADSLVAGGYDAIHVRDLGMAAAPDEDIFALATQEDRIIVSADTDLHYKLLACFHTFSETFVDKIKADQPTNRDPLSNVPLCKPATCEVGLGREDFANCGNFSAQVRLHFHLVNVIFFVAVKPIVSRR
jgi:hypothetical protein